MRWLPLLVLLGCAASRPARLVQASHAPRARAVASLPLTERIADLTPLPIDLDAVPWLGAGSNYLEAELTLKVWSNEQGWHVDVAGVPLTRGAPTRATFLAWQPPIFPTACGRGGARGVRWHALDETLVYHSGDGVFDRSRCAITNLTIAEVKPVPIVEQLFLAFRRRCDACAAPREKLVLIGPAVFDAIGIAALQNGPRSIFELPIERGTGASVAISIAGTDANRWAGEIGAPSWGKVGVIQVALEVAYPTAVARITVSS